MNKILYIVLGFVFVTFLALTGFYFYKTGTIPNPLSQFTQKIGATTWQDAKKQAISDCKIQNFTNDDPDPQYVLKLLKAAGSNITYDANSKTYNSPDKTAFEIKGVNSCYFIWLGDPSSTTPGKLVYESKSGDIKQITVTDRPSTVNTPSPESSDQPSPAPSP